VKIVCPACGADDTVSNECEWQEINCPTCWADIIAEPIEPPVKPTVDDRRDWHITVDGEKVAVTLQEFMQRLRATDKPK